MFLELQALTERVNRLEKDYCNVTDYADEMEERMSHMETVLKTLLEDNAYVSDATRTVMERVIRTENQTDDIQRILDDFDAEMEMGAEAWEEIRFWENI